MKPLVENEPRFYYRSVRLIIRVFAMEHVSLEHDNELLVQGGAYELISKTINICRTDLTISLSDCH